MAASVVTWFIKSNCPTVDISTAHRIVGLVTNSPSYCLRAMVFQQTKGTLPSILCFRVFHDFTESDWGFDHDTLLMTETSHRHGKKSYQLQPFRFFFQTFGFSKEAAWTVLISGQRGDSDSPRWSKSGDGWLEMNHAGTNIFGEIHFGVHKKHFRIFQVRGLWSVSYV